MLISPGHRISRRRQRITFALLIGMIGLSSARGADIEPGADEFGREIAASTAKHDPSVLEAAIDLRSIAMLATVDIPVEPVVRDAFVRGFTRGDAIHQFTTTLLKAKCTYRYAHLVDGKTRLMFRLVNPQGLNYLDFKLEKKADGSLAIADFFVLASGEMFSRTISVPYAMAVAEQQKNAGILRQVLGADNTVSNGFLKFPDINKAFQSGKYQDALDGISAMPPALQKLKIVLLIQYQCDVKLYGKNSPKIGETIDEMRAALPDDPSLDFLSLDSYIQRKQWDKADRSLRHVQDFAGGHDGYVDVQRSAIQKLAGHSAQAMSFADLAMADEPTLKDGYYARIHLALMAEDYTTTATLLTTLHDKLHERFKDLKTVPTYSGFVKSPEYADWMKKMSA